MAVVIETLKCGLSLRCFIAKCDTLTSDKPILQEIQEKTTLQSIERITFPRKTPAKAPTSNSLILVLLHDLLFSPKTRIEASDKWPPKEAVMRHQARLKAELVKIQIKQGKSSKTELARVGTSGVERYIRWNPNVDLHHRKEAATTSATSKWSLESLYAHLEKKGFKRTDEAIYPVPSGTYFLDPHLDDCLLVFPAETSWWIGDEWYESGAVILQDKASCFPARVLMDGWDGKGECVDAT